MSDLGTGFGNSPWGVDPRLLGLNLPFLLPATATLFGFVKLTDTSRNFQSLPNWTLYIAQIVDEMLRRTPNFVR